MSDGYQPKGDARSGTPPVGGTAIVQRDEAQASKGLICPWMRQECPGQDKCAPAALGRLSPVCPIVASVEVLELFGAIAAPLIESMTKVVGSEPDISSRAEFLKKVVKPDQEWDKPPTGLGDIVPDA